MIFLHIPPPQSLCEIITFTWKPEIASLFNLAIMNMRWGMSYGDGYDTVG